MTGVGAHPLRLAGRAFAAVATSAADLLMPPRCAGCDAPGTLLCDRCRAALPRIEHDEACPRCGAPDGLRGCAECGRLDLTFTGARCAGVFEWPLSRLVTVHKDAGELRLTDVLATLAADAAGEWAQWADVVVPVPASPGALARRGFDHGALLAAEFAHRTGLIAFDALRAMPRRDQRHLSAERRARNARTSLVMRVGVRVPARVIVLDDVMTTGATMEAATLAMLGGGAAEVRAVAVARACSGHF